MGKQFGFIMDKNDEEELLNYFLKNGDLYIDDAVSGTTRCCEIPQVDWVNVYYYRNDFGEMIFHKLNNGLNYINTIDAPVIEFGKTVISSENKCTLEGRIYFRSFYYDGDGEKIVKASSINDEYKKCVNFIKARLKRVDFNIGDRKKGIYVSKSLIGQIEF